MSFADQAIGITDELLNMMKGKINDNHPLAKLLFEAAMSVREVLCCWELNGLHHVAYEHLVQRNFSTKLYLNGLSRNVLPPMESYLHKFSAAVGQGWQRRWFSIHNHHMTFHRGKGEAPHKALDLTNYMEISPLLTGNSDPEFIVNIHTKMYKFKAPTDRKRCMWVEVLEHYQRRREINAHLISTSPSAKLKLFTEEVFTPQTPRDKQYLFSTLNLDAPDPRVRKIEEATTPFSVSTKPLGKGKGRTLEVRFNGDTRQILITKTEENTPYIQLSAPDILDHKYTDKKYLVQFYVNRDGRKNTKSWHFPSESEFSRFKRVFVLFRQFNNGFLFYHMNVLKRFRTLNESEIQSRRGGLSIVIQQNEKPAVEVDQLPPPSPSTTVRSDLKNNDSSPLSRSMPSPGSHSKPHFSPSTSPQPLRPVSPMSNNSRRLSPTHNFPPNGRLPPKTQKPKLPGSKAPPPASKGFARGRKGPPLPTKAAPPGRRGPPLSSFSPPPGRRGPPSSGRSPPPGRRGPPSSGRSPPSGRRGPPLPGQVSPPGRRGPPLPGKSPPPGRRGAPTLPGKPVPPGRIGRRGPPSGRRGPPSGPSPGRQHKGRV